MFEHVDGSAFECRIANRDREGTDAGKVAEIDGFSRGVDREFPRFLWGVDHKRLDEGWSGSNVPTHISCAELFCQSSPSALDRVREISAVRAVKLARDVRGFGC